MASSISSWVVSYVVSRRGSIADYGRTEHPTEAAARQWFADRTKKLSRGQIITGKLYAPYSARSIQL